MRDRQSLVQPYHKLNLITDPSIFDKEAHLRPPHLVDDDDVDRANKILSRIYNLYGGYMQISLGARDEILESEFMRLFLKQM